ncbi:cytokine receptor-like factor 3 [Cylas formicarius]|uniref:cytokine receptor-like factor 3 n=1 Tax=Cylas formicarius TaxID=197179 RepID=UPI0029584DF2|nr:cytokine receptor-like factor 3 [Cylas formicarius]
MDFEIKETLAAAQSYLNNLNLVNGELKNAEKQIRETYEETVKNISDTFSNLEKCLEHLLKIRRNALLEEAEQIKERGLLPLKQSLKIVSEKIDNTNQLIVLGQAINKSGNDDTVDAFLGSASLLGTLPEVPELKEVPFISFQVEPSHRQDIETICSNFGEIYHIGPVQIKTAQEKPGAILVEWEQRIDNEDRCRDVQEFRLQRVSGDVTKYTNLTDHFLDCYIGADTQFLARDLQVSRPYSFRVCCKFDGTTEWSPWSVAQVALTNVRGFCWRQTSGFRLSHNDKIAQALGDHATILYSDGPQVSAHDSVEFTILEVDTADAFLGLIPRDDLNLKKLIDDKGGSLVLTRDGRIFIDGVEKSTVLPQFVKGLKVCFSCERLPGSKIRVNVDSSDKRVTYDWQTDDSPLHFACQLWSNRWKIMVE